MFLQFYIFFPLCWFSYFKDKTLKTFCWFIWKCAVLHTSRFSQNYLKMRKFIHSISELSISKGTNVVCSRGPKLNTQYVKELQFALLFGPSSLFLVLNQHELFHHYRLFKWYLKLARFVVFPNEPKCFISLFCCFMYFLVHCDYSFVFSVTQKE